MWHRLCNLYDWQVQKIYCSFKKCCTRSVLRTLRFPSSIFGRNKLEKTSDLATVVKAATFIKSNSIQDRLFRQLCEEYDEEFLRLLLHTEVQWLSKGNHLCYFVTLCYSTVLSLSDKDLGEDTVGAKCAIFYLSDIFETLNLLNKQSQG